MYNKITSFKNYITNLGISRLLFMLFGNVLLGIGVSFYKHAALGNDPFSAMSLSLSALTPLSYGTFLLLFNLFLFSFQYFFGKNYIGIGTIANWTIVGYSADFCIYMDTHYLSISNSLFMRIIILCFAIVITAFGVSFYQYSSSGVSPYDYLSIGLSEKTGIPYTFCRIACDGTAVLIAFFTGGLLGVGTLATVLLLGPLISFFTKNISSKLIPLDTEEKASIS